MKTTLLSHSDLSGGAAIAAHRLHNGLRRINVDSQMIVLRKTSDDPTVHELAGPGSDLMRRRSWGVNGLPLRIYRHRDHKATWSVNWFPYTCAWGRIKADIVHLHWVGQNFLPLGALNALRAPIVWTLHDEWAYTGGCHYSGGCERFTARCGACPQLSSRREHDLSRGVWAAKSRSWRDLPITIVTPSTWLAERARRSSLFADRRIEVIPNGLDLDLFAPRSKHANTDRMQILFGADRATDDPRKGFVYLVQALELLASAGWEARAQAVVFGESDSSTLPLPSRSVGRLSDANELAALYSNADVFVAPSTQDNLPNTIMESLACGTPVVAFRIGGIPDLIEHQVNGYLAEPFDTADLARGIAWVLEDAERLARLRAAARAKAEREYEITAIARRYLALYEDILSRPAHR